MYIFQLVNLTFDSRRFSLYILRSCANPQNGHLFNPFFLPPSSLRFLLKLRSAVCLEAHSLIWVYCIGLVIVISISLSRSIYLMATCHHLYWSSLQPSALFLLNKINQSLNFEFNAWLWKTFFCKTSSRKPLSIIFSVIRMLVKFFCLSFSPFKILPYNGCAKYRATIRGHPNWLRSLI